MEVGNITKAATNWDEKYLNQVGYISHVNAG